MMDYFASDSALIATASAIRSKRGIADGITYLSSTGFADAISQIPEGVDVTDTTATAADVFNNTYFYTSAGVKTQGTLPSGTVLPVGNLSVIPSSAYINNMSIRYVRFPVCTTIGDSAFYQCGNLKSVSFPACTTIGIYAFGSCRVLTSVSFPVCTYIERLAFISCVTLVSVNFPVCTTISRYAFSGCLSLTTAIFPACTIIDTGAFQYCSALTSISFPVCTSIKGSGSTPGFGAFYGCRALTSVSFPVCTYIESLAFNRCASLSVIYLAASSVATLVHSNAFGSTQITSSKGSIFVPSSLVASYKAAANWSRFSNRIFGF